MCASICTSTWSSSWAETGLRAAWLADTAHRGACTEATGQHRTVWKRGTRWPSGHKIQTARYLRTSSLKAVYQETPKSVLQDRCGRCVRECILTRAVLAGRGC